MARPVRNYPKGQAKKEEILQIALELVATRGFDATTVRELASAASLTTAGLLHHFGTKEQLFAEVLQRRDDQDSAAATGSTQPGELFPNILRRNAAVPGLIQLYTRLSAEAIGPTHAAHEYFTHRYADTRARLTDTVRDLQRSGEVTDQVDANTLGAVLLAAMDGLQLQWLYDETLDMERTIGSLMQALRPRRGD